MDATQTAESSIASADPFNIKTNDLLGIRLGMSLTDYKRRRPTFSQECLKETLDSDFPCFIILPENRSRSLTLGGARVVEYEVDFYQHRLIAIYYGLSLVDDGGPLRKALKEKFGSPKSLIEDEWSRKNAVSSMDLSVDEKLYRGRLQMRLDKEIQELYERTRKRRENEAKGDL